MKVLSKCIATFFGIGYFPIAPGTLASFITVLLYKYFLYQLAWSYYIALGLGLYFMGVWTSSIVCRETGKDDPPIAVIDEVLGQLIALFLLSPVWPVMLASFFLFRLLDILKPFLIKKAEAFSQGWGIMLDDIVAGLYASIATNIYLLLK